MTEDEHFVEYLKSYIKNRLSFHDPRVKWEFLKYKIFGFSKGYANEQAEKMKARRTSLDEKKVCDLEKQVVETKANSDSIVAEYENAKIELEKLDD